MDQNYFRSIVLYQFPSLFTDRIRHNDSGTVSFYCPDQSQADPLVAAGRLYNNRIRPDLSFLFRSLDHIQGGPGLDGSSYVNRLKLYQYLCIFRAGHPVQPDQGRIAHSFQNIMVYHILTFLTLKIPFQNSFFNKI